MNYTCLLYTSGYEHVTVTEGEEPIVLKASELDNITVDGVEYQVSAEAMDLTVEYRENVNEYRWAVAMEKVPVANSKDVTVQITYYDPSITTGNNQIGTGYKHVTVTEGEEPIVLKASELDNITVDGVEYQVSAEAMDLTVEYRENVNCLLYTSEYLRTISHLRPRTNTFQAVFRVRSLIAYAIHR